MYYSHQKNKMITGTTILRRASLLQSSRVCCAFPLDPWIANVSSLVALEKTTTEEDRPEVEDPGKTIRPTRSPAGPATIPLPQIPTVDPVPTVEDWSDLAADEDEQKLEDKVAGFKVYLASFLY